MAFMCAPAGPPPFAATAAAAAVERHRPSLGGWRPRRHVVPQWRAAAPPPEGEEGGSPRGSPSPSAAEPEGSPPPPSLSSEAPPAMDSSPASPPPSAPKTAPPSLRLWQTYSEEEQAADIEALDAAAAEWIGSDLNRWAWYESIRSRRAELLGRANRETAAAEVEVARLAEAIEELEVVLGVQLLQRPAARARRGGGGEVEDNDDGRGGVGGDVSADGFVELTAAGWAVVALALGLPIMVVVAVVSVVMRLAPKLLHVGLF
ncbi:hypothetical protein MMPV_004314 [Pyropia vietnamensis]